MAHSGIRHDSTRSTVLRAGAILDAFRAEDVELSLGDLALRTGLPKSTVYRIGVDLVEVGLLERGEQGYRLGLKLFELGHLIPLNRRLREAALPFLTDLHEATKLTTNLAVRDGNEVVYLEKLVQRRARVPHTRSGGRLPLHCTALGKAILAFSTTAEVNHTLHSLGDPMTPHSINDPGLLRRELAEIKHTRLAYDDQESQLGLFCVASPILAAAGVVGAISASGARDQEQARHLGYAVLTAARGLSRLLGGLGERAKPTGV